MWSSQLIGKFTHLPDFMLSQFVFFSPLLNVVDGLFVLKPFQQVLIFLIYFSKLPKTILPVKRPLGASYWRQLRHLSGHLLRNAVSNCLLRQVCARPLFVQNVGHFIQQNFVLPFYFSVAILTDVSQNQTLPSSC